MPVAAWIYAKLMSSFRMCGKPAGRPAEAGDAHRSERAAENSVCAAQGGAAGECGSSVRRLCVGHARRPRGQPFVASLRGGMQSGPRYRLWRRPCSRRPPRDEAGDVRRGWLRLCFTRLGAVGFEVLVLDVRLDDGAAGPAFPGGAVGGLLAAKFPGFAVEWAVQAGDDQLLQLVSDRHCRRLFQDDARSSIRAALPPTSANLSGHKQVLADDRRELADCTFFARVCTAAASR
jgi:hypothetical protein